MRKQKQSRFLKAVDRTVKGRGGKGIKDLEASQLPLKLIDPDENQPRVKIDVEAPDFMALRASIREFGVLEPILVSQQSSNSRYQIISGHRRYLASLEEKKTHIPARIYGNKWTIEQVRLIQLAENIHRKDLYPLEIYRCLAELKKSAKMTQKALGEKLGLSQSAVSKYLQLANLDSEWVKAVESEPDKFSLRMLLDILKGEDPVAAESAGPLKEKSSAERSWRPRAKLVQGDQSYTLRRSRGKGTGILLEFPQSMSPEELLSAVKVLVKSLNEESLAEIDKQLSAEPEDTGSE